MKIKRCNLTIVEIVSNVMLSFGVELLEYRLAGIVVSQAFDRSD